MPSWVDHKNYLGPDRRKKRSMRLGDRREYDYGGNAPSLSAAVRQLRMHVLEAHGAGVPKFIARVKAVAWLAEQSNELKAAAHLYKIASVMQHQGGGERDLRSALYPALDRVAEVIINAS